MEHLNTNGTQLLLRVGGRKRLTSLVVWYDTVRNMQFQLSNECHLV